MKKLLVVAVLALALAGCRKTNDSACKTNWRELKSGVELSDSEVASFVLGQEMLPNSVGAYAQQCLREGWRPAGL